MKFTKASPVYRIFIRSFLLACFLLFCFFFFPQKAFATAITSNGTGGGNWSAGASWTGGLAPGEGDTCQIRSGDTITIDSTIIVGADTTTPAIDILSGGTLDWDNAGNDTLTLKGDFYVRSGGTLTLDGSGDGTKTLTVKLNYSSSLVKGKYMLVPVGTANITLKGASLTRYYDTLTSQATNNQAVITTTNDNSAVFKAGDELLIVTTGDKGQTELKFIDSINGQNITLTTNLSYTHSAGGYVLNLTRNIFIDVYNTSYGTAISGASHTGTMDVDWASLRLGTNSTYTLLATNASIDNSVYRNSSLGHWTNSKQINWTNCVVYNTGAGYDNTVGTQWTDSFLVDTQVSGYAGGRNMSFTNCKFIDSVNGFTSHQEIGATFTNCSFEACTYGIKTYTTGELSINGSLDNCSFLQCSSALQITSAFALWEIENSTFGSAARPNTNNIYISSTGSFDARVSNSSYQGTLVNMLSSYEETKIRVWSLGGEQKTYTGYGSYEKQSTVKRSGDYALLMSPTGASNELIAESTVPASNGTQIVVSAYFRKSVSMATLPYLKLSGAGITATTATMTNSTDTWELLTVSGTPTEDGFAKVEFVCQNASGSVYVDDATDSFDYWYEGDLPPVFPVSFSSQGYVNKPGSGAASVKVLGTEYQSSEAGTIYAQVLDLGGSPVNTATVTISAYDNDGTVVINAQSMTYVTATNGIYKYDFTAPSAEGVYVVDVTVANPTAYGTAEIHVSSWANAIATASEIAAAVWDRLTSAITTTSSIGKLLVDNINTTISSRSSLSSSDVWSYTTRNLTSSTATQTSIDDLEDKIDSLNTLVAINRQLLEKVANAPQIKVWYEKGSIILKAEIKNPSTSLTQMVEFKQILPREIKPEHIVNLDGLKIEYDSTEEAYYLYGGFKLAPQEKITKAVEIKNVWQISDSEIENLKKNASQSVDFLKGSPYFAQGSMLANEINTKLDAIKEKQEKAITPEEYITVYRENLADLETAKKNFETLKGFVLSWEGEKKVVANVGGIQITATWGIILAVVVGLGLLGLTNLYFLGLRGRMLTPGPTIAAPAKIIPKKIKIPFLALLSIFAFVAAVLLSLSLLKLIS